MIRHEYRESLSNSYALDCFCSSFCNVLRKPFRRAAYNYEIRELAVCLKIRQKFESWKTTHVPFTRLCSSIGEPFGLENLNWRTLIAFYRIVRFKGGSQLIPHDAEGWKSLGHWMWLFPKLGDHYCMPPFLTPTHTEKNIKIFWILLYIRPDMNIYYTLHGW